MRLNTALSFEKIKKHKKLIIVLFVNALILVVLLAGLCIYKAMKDLELSQAPQLDPVEQVIIDGPQEIEPPENITPVVDNVEVDETLPVPGERTIKNLIKTSLAPVGKCLYVYGGGWNVEDTGAGPEALQLGVADSWVDFFEQNKGKFNYRYVLGSNNQVDDKNGTYPFAGVNNFYYDGMDCSAYIGWIIYNVMTTEEQHKATCDENGVGVDPGYVKQAVYMAKAFSDDYGYGSFYRSLDAAGGKLLPGDIVSIHGHVYMCLGTCNDGSIIILHSTPSADRNGEKGGGVQLTALDPNENPECDAMKLSREYMKENCPDWFEYYDVCMKSYSYYTNFSQDATTGIFRWNIDGNGLSDPDGYMDLSAEEILKDIR